MSTNGATNSNPKTAPKHPTPPHHHHDDVPIDDALSTPEIFQKVTRALSQLGNRHNLRRSCKGKNWIRIIESSTQKTKQCQGSHHGEGHSPWYWPKHLHPVHERRCGVGKVDLSGIGIEKETKNWKKTLKINLGKWPKTTHFHP